MDVQMTEAKPAEPVVAEAVAPAPVLTEAVEPSAEKEAIRSYLEGQLKALLGTEWVPDSDPKAEQLRKFEEVRMFYDRSERMGWGQLGGLLRAEPGGAMEIIAKHSEWFDNLMDDRQMLIDFVMGREPIPRNPNRFKPS